MAQLMVSIFSDGFAWGVHPLALARGGAGGVLISITSLNNGFGKVF